jgi:hypothetical protein
MDYQATIPEKWAHQIYTILEDLCQAVRDPENRGRFVLRQKEGCREFRFGGILPGGKFWNDGFRWYVTCYEAFRTNKERKKAHQVMEIANKALADLREQALQEEARKHEERALKE